MTATRSGKAEEEPCGTAPVEPLDDTHASSMGDWRERMGRRVVEQQQVSS
jgi:hypothetical protein